MAAVNNQGEVIWYQENHKIGSLRLGDVQLDDTGNVYLAGWASANGGADSFAGFDFEATGTGSGMQDPFLIKLDPGGSLLWGTNPDLYSPFPGQSIVINGNNVYLGLGMLENTWGDLDIPAAPNGAGLTPDIQIVRFDAQTGAAEEVIQNTEVHTPTQDAIMAMALDNNGDLVVGGYFGSSLFYGTDLYLQDNATDSDFFIAKYKTANEDNPCAAPTDVTVGNIEAQSVKISWTPGGEEAQWEVAYGESGFNPNTEGNTVTVNNTPETTLGNLEPETDYVVYVRAICGEDSHSDWTGPENFTTEELSVEDHQAQVLKVYPNPTTGLLTLQSKMDLENYQLFDLRGRIVKQGNLENKQVDLSSIENGLYILRVEDRNGGVQNLKVVKE